MYTLIDFYDTPEALDYFIDRETTAFSTSDDDLEIYRANCGFCLIPLGCDPTYVGESWHGAATALYLDKDANLDNGRICLGVGASVDDDYAFVDHLYTVEEMITSMGRDDGEMYRGLFWDSILRAIIQASADTVLFSIYNVMNTIRTVRLIQMHHLIQRIDFILIIQKYT